MARLTPLKTLHTVTLCCLSFNALAIERGTYINLSLGTSKLDLDSSETNYDNGLSYHLTAGYKFLPYLGADISLGQLGGFQKKGLVDLDINIAKAGISLWGDIGDSTEIFAKLGLLYTSSEVEHPLSNEQKDYSGHGFYYDMGALFNLTETIGVSAAISYFQSDIDGIDFHVLSPTIGLQVNF